MIGIIQGDEWILFYFFSFVSAFLYPSQILKLLFWYFFLFRSFLSFFGWLVISVFGNWSTFCNVARLWKSNSCYLLWLIDFFQKKMINSWSFTWKKLYCSLPKKKFILTDGPKTLVSLQAQARKRCLFLSQNTNVHMSKRIYTQIW